jgi:tetratricopeptide (TPR) repeat protein
MSFIWFCWLVLCIPFHFGALIEALTAPLSFQSPSSSYGARKSSIPLLAEFTASSESHSSSTDLEKLGVEARSTGELDAAVSYLEAAVRKDPSNASAHLNLGTVLQKQRKLAEAVGSLRSAMSVFEECGDNDLLGEAKFQIGLTLTEMGYVEDAIGSFSELLAKESNQQGLRRVKIMLANVLLDGRGEKSRPKEIYLEACKANPASPIHVLAGCIYDSEGDHEAAKYHYKSAWETSKGADQEAALHLSMSYTRDGSEEEKAMLPQLRSRLSDFVRSSADYIVSQFAEAIPPSAHYFTYDMLHLGMENASLKNGLILEFGVFHGKTIRMIAENFPTTQIHGFDTFSGIPENWHNTKKGSYSTHNVLPVAPGNVQYHVGLFSDTLPSFLDQNKGEPIRFMNIDCDLYSSTKDIFDLISDRVVSGTIIIFDEYVMNPHWMDDEHKAFQEAVERNGWQYEYIGISLLSMQAVVRIL